jgi:hypothetical protein
VRYSDPEKHLASTMQSTREQKVSFESMGPTPTSHSETNMRGRGATLPLGCSGGGGGEGGGGHKLWLAHAKSLQQNCEMGGVWCEGGSEEGNGIAVVNFGRKRGVLLWRGIFHSIWGLEKDGNGPICGCENGK